MTFLNPFLLFGLIAAAIPIIVHLLNLRKLKTIEFSTLRFLKELQKTKMRRVKIRQWLLLALRTLIIVSVVMAFSRPALRGSLAGFGGHATAKTTIIILLDDSPSMNVRNERGVFFAQAKGAAASILDLAKDGDETYLIALSDVRRTPRFVPSYNPAPLKTLLAQLSPSNETVSFREGLGVSAKILAESKNFNQEVYLVTDVQATQFEATQTLPDTVDLFDDKVRLFLSDVRSGSTTSIENAGITSVEVTSKVITQNKAISLLGSVHNAGASMLKSTVLSMYLDGTRIVQHTVDCPPNRNVSASLLFAPKRRGILNGYLQLEDDAFEQDNKRYFALNVPNGVNVLAVGSGSEDTRLATLALTLDKDSTVAGLFAVEQITESQLSSRDLNKYDILLLCNVKDFSSGEGERIGQFVAAGGGVMLFAGNDIDIGNYSNVLLANLGIPKNLSRKTVGEATDEHATFLSFGKIEFTHPLFAGLFDQPSGKNRQPLVESPRVFNTLVPQPGTQGRGVISLSDGTSFLTEYEHGTGKILLYSVEAGLTWSDFPLKGLFVPLLYRSGLYLSQSGSTPSFIAGDEMRFTLRLRNRSDKDAFLLRSPSGIDERIVPQFSASNGMALFTTMNSTEIGIYELRKDAGSASGELLQSIPVNIAPGETDLRHASNDLYEQFFETLGFKPGQVQTLSSSATIDAAIIESRFGVELWKYFIGIALLLALVEMTIGRESKEQNA